MMQTSNYESIIDNLYDGVYYLDKERRIKIWSKGAEYITGYTGSEVLGRQCSDSLLAHTSLEGKNLCRLSCLMSNALDSGSYYKTEAFIKHKDGHDVQISLRISPMFDSEGNIIGVAHIFTNNEAYITKTKTRKNYEVYFDLLTDFPSRYNSEIILKNKIEEFRRYKWPFAVFLVEIDHFDELCGKFDKKVFSDLIKQFSNLLKHDVRPFDIIGRWSENQFLVILINVKKEVMMMLGERMRKLIELTDFKSSDYEVKMTISQGGVLVGKAISFQEIHKKLNKLIKDSQDAGGNNSSFYVFH
jgi:diguanylate cyclase (GGDEF)-like protein/PAS domain S-box-containing protein